jgi:hypothetical protein
MAEIINISSINPITFEFQDYSIEDTNLITNLEVSSVFDPQKNKIEFFIYDLNNNVIYQNVNNFNQYTVTNSDTIVLDPGLNVTSQGFTEGQYNVVYNFIENKLASSPENKYFISEISPDRTEIRLDTTQIPNNLVISSSLELISDIQNSTGSYYDFYLDFSSNNLIIAVNALLDTSSVDDPTVLIKLYEPLPSEFDIKTECWGVVKVADSLAYNVNIDFIFELVDTSINLKGPNFNLAISDQINNSTQYLSYSGLKQTTGSLSQGTGSLSYQLNNLLAQTGITVNIDYSDYSNFIHFSSAQTRLENFYYKLQLLEGYTYSASLSSNPSSGSYYISSSNIVWQAKIDEIITGFDNYEYYLYYTSGSTSWPKTGPTPPYVNVGTSTVTGLNWLANQLLVAEEYDIENNNALTLAIPSYIRDDSQNEKFELFVEMVGQLFDDIFVYLQNITTKFDADNRLNYGVSKDLVADILRDMGITIYQNNFSSNDVYQALLGLTPSGSLYNLPYTTAQYPVPSGSFLDYITNYVTASSTSSLIPTDDINKERYKRIYHNLPLLLKKKGSVAGLRDLITTFGIPDTILRINEFGGKDKSPNTWDNWQDEYNYAFYTSGSAYVTSSFVLNSAWGASSDNPQSVEFRFKTDGLPQNTASIASQSLWLTDTGVNLRLRYTGSGYTTSSLISGSADPVNPYYQYAALEFTPEPSNPSNTASIYLPFYDGGWWSVLINRNSTGDYTLYAADKNYEGVDGNTIGFQSSSSVSTIGLDTNWTNSTISTFASASYKIFTGSLQEIRYYTQPISKSTFDAYVMNPYSSEQSEYLAFRATLGGELYTASVSVHPKVDGSWVTTSSFASNSNFYTSSGAEYTPNTEVFYFDQVPAGIQNAISQKIKQQSTILPYSSTDTNIPSNTVLSPYISVQQYPAVSASYTKDVDYVEIAFSPQNEINEDINSQIGYFNIGEVIGDPRFQTSSLSSYPDLDAIRYRYFEKYISNYDYTDYVRLIKFFDNSLFKMLQDFVPARTDLAAGIVIKNTLLDRNRYRIPLVSPSSSLANIGSGSTNIPYIVEDLTITGSIDVGTISGGNGGSMPDLFGQTQSFDRFVNITQVWSGSTPSLTGSVSFVQSSQVEFYNGELSGSAILVEDGNLSDCNVEIIQVYTTASIPISSPSYIFKEYDLDIDKTYYLSFTINNDAGASGTGGGTIYYSDILEQLQTIYYIDNLTPGQSITIDKLEISNVLGNKASNSTEEITSVQFNIPLYFLSIDFGGANITLTDFTIYESYIEPDCLVVDNDVEINRPSSKYMDVDFNEGQILPVNQQVILSGSAVKAAVPDSYYSPETGWANARYFGSDYTGQYNYTASFATSSFPIGYPIDNFVNYFIYYDWIGGSDPQYPGGGNVHGIYLISTEGVAVPLTQENKNLFTVENAYVGGTPAYIYPAVFSSGKTGSYAVEVIDGGAIYETILYTSTQSSINYRSVYDYVVYNNSIPEGTGGAYFTASSPWNVLELVNGYSFITSSMPNYGNVSFISPGSNTYIYDKATGISKTGPNEDIDYNNTYLPLQYGDYIRFGSGSIGLDSSWTAAGLTQVVSFLRTGSEDIYGTSSIMYGTSSLISIYPPLSSSITSSLYNIAYGNLQLRIIRRVSNETFVLIKDKPPYLDPGFLIPFNFNPNYNPYDLARKAGVIQ